MRRTISLMLLSAPLLAATACSDGDSSGSGAEATVEAGDDVESDSTARSSNPPDTTTDTTTDTTANAPSEARDVEAFGFLSDDDLDPGRYYADPDLDPATPLRVSFDVGAAGWTPWNGVAKVEDYGYALFTVATPTNVVRDGCRDHIKQDPPVGPTVDDLAEALAVLPPFELTAPPSEVSLGGYSGLHLQLTIPVDTPSAGRGDDRYFTECVDQTIHSWVFSGNDSFYGYNGEPGRTEEFWILDVDGTRLMISTNTSPETPAETRAELQAIFDSLRIET